MNHSRPKRTFFFKTYICYIAVVMMTFVLLSGLVYHQLSNFVLQEKQSELASTLSNIADQTKMIYGIENEDVLNFYKLSISRLAEEDQVTVLVGNADGAVQWIASPNGTMMERPGLIIAHNAVKQIQYTGMYSQVGSLGILQEASSYAVGSTVTADDGSPIAMVFVATEDKVMAGTLRRISQTLLLILLVTLTVAMLVAYMVSMRMTQPLGVIAQAAKAFAGGNFEVRVSEDSGCLEIDELAVSFNNMASELAQLEELTRGFIGNVSHEFKTPMTTIGGFVDGMVDGTIPPEQHEKYLHIIAEETRRLSRMVNRMLDAAKIQSGELLLSPAPFDFSEMTSQIIISFEQKIEKKKLEVDCDLTDRLFVMGDRDHIFRAVYNLVDNAVKFIEEGGRLTLKAHEEGAFCAFSITNTGIGISAEDLPHVFDRFYKADRSRSMDKTGAGLGLYIVKNIINLHGGEIAVRSDGGETEFSFTLPLVKQKEFPTNMPRKDC